MSRPHRVAEISIRRRIELFERVYAELKANPYGQATDVTLRINAYADHTEVLTNLENEHVWVSYLTSFRQMISPKDDVCLDHMLRELPRHVDDEGLRHRLHEARLAWKATKGIPSQFAPMVLGDYASGEKMAQLYLYGRIFHNKPELSDIWESLTPNDRTFVKHQFRVYESKVRNVIIEVKNVINEARQKGVLTEEPIDFQRPA